MLEERDEHLRKSIQAAVVHDDVRMSLQPSASSGPQQRTLLPRPTHGDAHREPPPKKYFKSRNGCVTCKARRRKCDETKPSCSQCLRRNLKCGGYSKDIKFVEFCKPASAERKSNHRNRPPIPGRQDKSTCDSALSPDCENIVEPSTGGTGDSDMLDRPGSLYDVAKSSADSEEALESSTKSFEQGQMSVSESNMDAVDLLFPQTSGSAPDYFLEGFMDPANNYNGHFTFPSISDATADLGGVEVLSDHNTIADCHGEDTALPEISMPELFQYFATQPSSFAPNHQALLPLYDHPSMTNDSPETVATVFDRRICEVLCIKDKPSGNPWRVMIWPLATEHAAVYHAVAAMTYFQWSNTLPQVRVRGMRHLQTSIQVLTTARDHSIPVEILLTTRLLLAFAESWYYPRSSCGVKHIHEAKRLLQRVSHMTPRSGSSCLPPNADHVLQRNFLARTWVYMDVLTRITCDAVEELDTDFVSQCSRGQSENQDDIDPLMGCAEPLFPLLGRVADLVRVVRKRASKRNSPAIIAQAVKLKQSIESWSPCTRNDLNVTAIEGEELSPVDSDIVQTAYAYKWAALLLLCQAVPEIPSRLSFVSIAQKILTVIATVPAESKASIFHIFPLMIAGCDTEDKEDREWICDRWQQLLAGGNSSGISERCLELTSEVWRRRDQHATWQQDQGRAAMAEEDATTCKWGFTVKSKLHWLSIMKEWEWEVLLG